MGEETREFATLYSSALADLARLAGEDTHAAFLREHGARAEARVRGALDAVAAVHETDTAALEDWAKERARVLARVTAVREALDRGGLDAEARRRAGELVVAVGAGRRRR
jgi:hypothetical protein